MCLSQPQSYTANLAIKASQSKQAIDSLKICLVCNQPKPSRFYHCRRCNICIYKMDHHCDWLNTCVGQYNIKPFVHLVVNLLINSLYTIIWVIGSNIGSILVNQDRKIYLMILLALPSLFLFYESQRLAIDVWTMFKSNQTLVESYKKVWGKNQKKIATIKQFMGVNIMLWFFPVYIYQQNIRSLQSLTQETISFCKQKVQELTYADQYIYGKDQ